ncbi:MAG: hypothetical protein IKP40_07345 [Clostridia bacterium]|nr:hypothetical protein [Clostridia bacterium]
MKKRTAALCLLLVCVLLLSACSTQQEPERFQVVTGTATPTIYVPLVTDAPLIDFDSGDYDPSSEEGGDTEEVATVFSEPITASLSSQPTSAPTVQSEYAGATPVPLDPIDKPTPTPAPALTIANYQVYDATKIGLSFEGPVDWTVNDAASDTFVLTNPDQSVDYQAWLSIRAVNVSSDYGATDMKKQVMNIRDEIRSEYSSFSPSNTASRTLLDKAGIYMDYTGTRKDNGAKVWGRIHVTCVSRTLYILQIACPQTYRETYKDKVYAKFRATVKITK